MAKKKIKLSGKMKDELKGFEEIMDFVLEENDVLEQSRKRNEIEKFNDTYELYNFLENELNRLEKLSEFLSKKIVLNRDNNQVHLLLEQEMEVRDRKTSELVTIISEKDSSFMKNFSRMFNSTFSRV